MMNIWLGVIANVLVVLAGIIALTWWASPPWAKIIIRYHLRGTIWQVDAVSSSKRQKKVFVSSKEASMGASRDIKEANTLWGAVKRVYKILNEYWEALTKDGCKPGLLEVQAFRMLMRQVKEERQKARDIRFEKDGDVVDNPGRMLRNLIEPCELANLAYEEDNTVIRKKLKERGLTLIAFENNSSPGTTSYFMAMDRERKIASVVIQGSNRLSDFLVNGSSGSFPYNLQGPFVEGGDWSMLAHEGFSLVANHITDDIHPIIEDFLITSNYRIQIIGHSLGGSLAIAVGIILRSRLGMKFPHVLKRTDNTVTVVAFAPAPTVDEGTAEDCTSFVTCVVNNSDIVPRVSIPNLVMGLAFLKILRKRLEERGARPMGDAKSIFRFYKTLRSDEPFMSMKEIEEGMEKAIAFSTDGHLFDDLYLPGNVMHMYSLWGKGDGEGRVKRMKITDGKSMALRYFEFDAEGRFLTNHGLEGPDGYLTSIRNMIEADQQQAFERKSSNESTPLLKAKERSRIVSRVSTILSVRDLDVDALFASDVEDFTKSLDFDEEYIEEEKELLSGCDKVTFDDMNIVEQDGSSIGEESRDDASYLSSLLSVGPEQ